MEKFIIKIIEQAAWVGVSLIPGVAVKIILGGYPVPGSENWWVIASLLSYAAINAALCSIQDRTETQLCRNLHNAEMDQK